MWALQVDPGITVISPIFIGTIPLIRKLSRAVSPNVVRDTTGGKVEQTPLMTASASANTDETIIEVRITDVDVAQTTINGRAPATA